MSSQEKMLSLDWEIAIQPVYTTGEVLLRGYQTIIRSDKNVALSVMKNSYNPRTNKEFVDIIQELAVIAKSEAPHYAEYDSGRKVLAYLPSPQKSSIAGHQIADQILVGNSFDGSSSLFIATILSYKGCNFTYLNRNASFRVSHRSKDLNQIFDYLEMIKDYEFEKQNLYNKFEEMNGVEVSDDEIEDLIKFAIGYKLEDEDGKEVEISTRTQNKIDELRKSIEKKINELGKNAWGLFNGVTHYTTHCYVGGRKKNVEGNMYGTQNTMNQRALNYCLDLI